MKPEAEKRGEFILREAYQLDDKVQQRLRDQLRDISKKLPKQKSLSPKDVAEDSVLRHAYLIYAQLSADAGHPTFSSLNRYIGRFEENGETGGVLTLLRHPKRRSLYRPSIGHVTRWSGYASEQIKFLKGHLRGKSSWG